MIKSNRRRKNIEPSPDDQKESDQQNPIKKQKLIKKPKKKLEKKQVIHQAKGKLPRGKKYCQNCKYILEIHRAICPQCGQIHSMRRTKDQILKNLTKKQPKAIRSILESRQFNQYEVSKTKYNFNQSQFVTLNEDDFDQLISDSQQQVPTNQKKLQLISSSKNHEVFKSEYYISCIASMGEDIILAEALTKPKITSRKLSKEEQITLKTYELQRLHLFGQKYSGRSFLSYWSTKQKEIIYRIVIEQDIKLIKTIHNLVVLLTGEGSIIVVGLSQKKQQYFNGFIGPKIPCFIIKDQIKVQYSQSFTTVQVLMVEGVNYSLKIIAGCSNGDIVIYNFQDNNVNLFRVISKAHHEHITALSSCPLVNSYIPLKQASKHRVTLFASGSYDGQLKIWSIDQSSPVFSIQISNKKITNIEWDPGAKFLFVTKDEINENCLLLCFYPISRNEDSVCLASEPQLRILKASGSTLKCSYNVQSPILPIIDVNTSIVSLFSVEDLRKNSLKKKKCSQDLKNEYNLEELIRKQVKKQGNKRSKHKDKQIQVKEQDVQQAKQLYKGFPIITSFTHFYSKGVNYIIASHVNQQFIILKVPDSQLGFI